MLILICNGGIEQNIENFLCEINTEHVRNR